jgi:hypothetical protein
MEPNIELAKPRDFGEIISDTFVFIRQNFKELLKNFFIFCGFFILIGMISSIIQQFQIRNLLIESGANTPPVFQPRFSGFWVTWVLTMGLALLMYTASTLTVICYVTLYKQKGNTAPTTEEIWAYFKYYFLRTTIGVFVTAILLGVGFMLCVLPGIWLFPMMGLIFPIMIIENTSFGYAFNRSFSLIKDNWWVTAGTILVIWIIAYVMIFVIMIPASAINITETLLRPKVMHALSTWQIIVSVIVQQLVQVLLILPTVALTLCYFNLAESKEGTSLLDRINKFGGENPQTNTNLPSEEY